MKAAFIIPTNPYMVITPYEFCEIQRISRATAQRMRAMGDYPPTVQLSSHRLGIVWKDYLEWRDARRTINVAYR